MQVLASIGLFAPAGLGALGMVSCAVSVVLMALTCAERETRALALSRRVLPALSFAIAVGAFSANAAAVAKATSSLAVLIGLEALALAWATPAWWPGFEREFRRYAATGGVGAQRGGS
jgi:hypothetical protein